MSNIVLLGLPGLYQNWLMAAVDPASKVQLHGEQNFFCAQSRVKWKIKPGTVEYPIANDQLIILNTEINWTPTLLSNAVKELENIKLNYFEKYNKSISKKDKKIITEWTYLRLLKIISTVIIKGNIASKIKAFQVLLLNSKILLSNKVMQNIFNRFVWLFNRIRYNN